MQFIKWVGVGLDGLVGCSWSNVKRNQIWGTVVGGRSLGRLTADLKEEIVDFKQATANWD